MREVHQKQNLLTLAAIFWKENWLLIVGLSMLLAVIIFTFGVK